MVHLGCEAQVSPVANKRTGRRIWKRFHSVDTWCHTAKDGRKKQCNVDHFKAYFPKLKAWIHGEQLTGAEVGVADVAQDFDDMVALEIRGARRLAGGAVKTAALQRNTEEE